MPTRPNVPPRLRPGQGDSTRHDAGSVPCSRMSPSSGVTSCQSRRVTASMVGRPRPRAGLNGCVAPFQGGCDVDVDRVDLPRVEEGAEDLAPPFDEEVRHPPAGELGEQGQDRNPSVPGKLQDLAAERGQRRDAVGGGLAGHRDPDGSVARGLREPTPDREAGGAIEHDPGGLTRAGRACRQLGVIGQRGPDPDEDRVHPAPQLVDAGARARIGDPSAVSRRRGGLAVEGHRPLGGDVGQAGGQSLQIGRIEPGGGLAQQADVDPQPRLAKPEESPARHPREGVSHRGDDPSDPRRQDRIGTGGRLARMAARLERDVQRRATRGGTGLGQGDDLGVGAAEAGMIPRPDPSALAHDHGPDHRVRLDAAATLPGLRQRTTHPEQVEVRHASRPHPTRADPISHSEGLRIRRSGCRPRRGRLCLSGRLGGRRTGRIRGAPGGGHLARSRVEQTIEDGQPTPGLFGREVGEGFADPLRQGGEEPEQIRGFDLLGRVLDEVIVARQAVDEAGTPILEGHPRPPIPSRRGGPIPGFGSRLGLPSLGVAGRLGIPAGGVQHETDPAGEPGAKLGLLHHPSDQGFLLLPGELSLGEVDFPARIQAVPEPFAPGPGRPGPPLELLSFCGSELEPDFQPLRHVEGGHIPEIDHLEERGSPASRLRGVFLGTELGDERHPFLGGAAAIASRLSFGSRCSQR